MNISHFNGCHQFVFPQNYANTTVFVAETVDTNTSTISTSLYFLVRDSLSSFTVVVNLTKNCISQPHFQLNVITGLPSGHRIVNASVVWSSLKYCFLEVMPLLVLLPLFLPPTCIVVRWLASQ